MELKNARKVHELINELDHIQNFVNNLSIDDITPEIYLKDSGNIIMIVSEKGGKGIDIIKGLKDFMLKYYRNEMDNIKRKIESIE